jgi:hypothetical protein
MLFSDPFLDCGEPLLDIRLTAIYYLKVPGQNDQIMSLPRTSERFSEFVGLLWGDVILHFDDGAVVIEQDQLMLWHWLPSLCGGGDSDVGDYASPRILHS